MQWCFYCPLQYGGLALDWIAQLYEIERKVKELDDAQRLAIRQARSKPVLEEFKTCLLARRMQLVNADVTARAIDYKLKRWVALVVHVDDAPDCLGQEKLAFYRLAVSR